MPLYGARADGNWSGSVWGLCDGVLRSDAQAFTAAGTEQVTQVFTLTNAVDRRCVPLAQREIVIPLWHTDCSSALKLE